MRLDQRVGTVVRAGATRVERVAWAREVLELEPEPLQIDVSRSWARRISTGQRAAAQDRLVKDLRIADMKTLAVQPRE